MSDRALSYPDKLEMVPLTKTPVATVRVPGSKSITNRALVLAALTSRRTTSRLSGVLQSEDAVVMSDCPRALGFRVLTEWSESEVVIGASPNTPLIPASQADLFVGNSGTTMRFLCAVVALGHGSYRLDGVPRMRERPIGDLIDALKQIGVEAFSVPRNGCPPVVVKANGLPGGTVRIRGSIRRQVLSGVPLAAPFADGPGHLCVAWPP